MSHLPSWARSQLVSVQPPWRETSRPTIVRVLLLVAAAILLAGSAYGVLASQSRQRTNEWSRSRGGFVVSGSCSRGYRLLPSLDPIPPDFVRLGKRTYTRGPEELLLPSRARKTRYSYRGWRMLRAGDRLYLERTDEQPPTGLGLPYHRGECP